MGKTTVTILAAIAGFAAMADMGLKEIGRLALIDEGTPRESVPDGFVRFRTDDPNPDDSYAATVEPLRRKVKSRSGALDIVREPPGKAMSRKYLLRQAIGDAARAIRSTPGVEIPLEVRSIVDVEALPSGITTNVQYKADTEGAAGRALTCAKFMRYNCALRFFWHSDRAPAERTAVERMTISVPEMVKRPVAVDMLTGRVYEIPSGNVKAEKKLTVISGVPVWDSPILVADRAFVPMHVEWEKTSPYGIVDLWYKQAQIDNHMKALPPEDSEPWMKMKTSDFLPCIDKYGQFVHRDWPGKTKSDDDLKRSAEEEEKDLAANPGPKDWNKYGGWLGGPQLKATGRFRTEKVDGKWWLVDPEGRLYWSFGPVRVTPSSGMTPLNGDTCKPRRGNALPLPDRDCLFAELPPAPGAAGANAFSKFWTTFDALLLPFYRDRAQTRIYDFSSANLYRKYGEDYYAKYADLAHRRLRSWGANTIANSSDLDICLMDRTPYAERVECESRTISGSYGMWKKFRDPWDESFSKGVTAALEKHGREAHDPWCIGFFVDNEIEWGRTPRQLAEWTLQSPADQPAKKAAVEFFRRKYGTIEKLNAAWKSSYSDWSEMLHSILLPPPASIPDLNAFTRVLVDEYFRKTRSAVKAFDPQLLYLGCRFVGSRAKSWVIDACVKSCDVVSYNIYLQTVGEWRLPNDLDAPVMVGEFHFGATDRGPFGTGVCVASNQVDRAERMKAYVRSALDNPQIVGVHWHQFADQATTGRFDGEYLQVGWTDICDTPYPEAVAAVRELGYSMYERRSGRKAAVDAPEKRDADEAAPVPGRVAIWPEGRMPGFQDHQVAMMRNETQKNTQPYLDWFPAPEKPNGGCVILVSGGGYQALSNVGPVKTWSRKFTELGFQCVNLVYRTPRPKGMPFYMSAWMDGQRAVRMVRSEASKRGFDPEKIGTVSVSAGAHLCTLLATSALTPAYDRVDATDDIPCHINWAVTSAIAYAMTDGIGVPNQRGGQAVDAKLDGIFKFDGKTAPMCMFHGSDDRHSPMSSTHIYRQLRKRNVPAELHLFADRPHALWGEEGKGAKATAYDNWFDRAVEFLAQLGFLGELAPEVKLMDRFAADFHDPSKYEKERVWPKGRIPDFQKHQCLAYIEWYIPSNLTTKAVQIVYSGGGYRTNKPEEFEVAPARRYLNEKGMAVVTVKYRTPRPNLPLAKHTTAWQDLQRVVRIVRSKASSKGLDPDRIGIMGSSAGGHLTLMGVASSRSQSYRPVDDIDKLPCNVQWGVGIYPAYALTDGIDRHNETGGNDDSARLVPELAFDPDTCPMVFIHGDADKWAAMNSVKVWEQMRRMGIGCDLHTLAKRPHCFEFKASPGTGSYTWLDRIWEFMNHKGFNN